MNICAHCFEDLEPVNGLWIHASRRDNCPGAEHLAGRRDKDDPRGMDPNFEGEEADAWVLYDPGHKGNGAFRTQEEAQEQADHINQVSKSTRDWYVKPGKTDLFLDEIEEIDKLAHGIASVESSKSEPRTCPDCKGKGSFVCEQCGGHGCSNCTMYGTSHNYDDPDLNPDYDPEYEDDPRFAENDNPRGEIEPGWGRVDCPSCNGTGKIKNDRELARNLIDVSDIWCGNCKHHITHHPNVMRPKPLGESCGMDRSDNWIKLPDCPGFKGDAPGSEYCANCGNEDQSHEFVNGEWGGKKDNWDWAPSPPPCNNFKPSDDMHQLDREDWDRIQRLLKKPRSKTSKVEMCCDGKQTAEQHRHKSKDGKCCVDKPHKESARDYDDPRGVTCDNCEKPITRWRGLVTSPWVHEDTNARLCYPNNPNLDNVYSPIRATPDDLGRGTKHAQGVEGHDYPTKNHQDRMQRSFDDPRGQGCKWCGRDITWTEGRGWVHRDDQQQPCYPGMPEHWYDKNTSASPRMKDSNISPKSASAPTPSAQGQGSDPWWDAGDHDGTAPPRPGKNVQAAMFGPMQCDTCGKTIPKTEIDDPRGTERQNTFKFCSECDIECSGCGWIHKKTDNACTLCGKPTPKQAQTGPDPFRDVSPSGRSAPAPAQGPTGDPWPDQADNGIGSPRPGMIFDKKLNKWIQQGQGGFPGTGVFDGVTDINKIGTTESPLCPDCQGEGDDLWDNTDDPRYQPDGPNYPPCKTCKGLGFLPHEFTPALGHSESHLCLWCVGDPNDPIHGDINKIGTSPERQDQAADEFVGHLYYKHGIHPDATYRIQKMWKDEGIADWPVERVAMDWHSSLHTHDESVDHDHGPEDPRFEWPGPAIPRKTGASRDQAERDFWTHIHDVHGWSGNNIREWIKLLQISKVDVAIGLHERDHVDNRWSKLQAINHEHGPGDPRHEYPGPVIQKTGISNETVWASPYKCPACDGRGSRIYDDPRGISVCPVCHGRQFVLHPFTPLAAIYSQSICVHCFLPSSSGIHIKQSAKTRRRDDPRGMTPWEQMSFGQRRYHFQRNHPKYTPAAKDYDYSDIHEEDHDDPSANVHLDHSHASPKTAQADPLSEDPEERLTYNQCVHCDRQIYRRGVMEPWYHMSGQDGEASFDSRCKPSRRRDDPRGTPHATPALPRYAQALPQQVGDHVGDNGINDPITDSKKDMKDVAKILPGTQKTVPDSGGWNVSVDNQNKTGANIVPPDDLACPRCKGSGSKYVEDDPRGRDDDSECVSCEGWGTLPHEFKRLAPRDSRCSICGWREPLEVHIQSKTGAKTRTVHVVSYDPYRNEEGDPRYNSDSDSSIGGFNWYYKEEDAKRDFASAPAVWGEHTIRRVQLKVPAHLDRDGITDWIDSDLDHIDSQPSFESVNEKRPDIKYPPPHKTGQVVHGEDDEYVPACPVCGNAEDYCQGHGEIGDPTGHRVMLQHDSDYHRDCHPQGCDSKEIIDQMTAEDKCPTCEGFGMLWNEPDDPRYPATREYGQSVAHGCPDCDGTGWSEKRYLHVAPNHRRGTATDLSQHLVRNHALPSQLIDDDLYSSAELDEFHITDHASGRNDHNPESLIVARTQRTPRTSRSRAQTEP